VLLVDDDADLRGALAMALDLAGLPVLALSDAAAALAVLGRQPVAAVVSDIRMPGMDGRQLAQRIAALDADLPVILMTGHGDIDQAVAALRQGAYDFLAKPFATERLVESVRRAVERRALALENRRLRSEAAAQSAPQRLPLLGPSAAAQRLVQVIAQLAGSAIDVLIEGEWGCGKRAVAQLLARGDSPVPPPIQLFDCEAFPAHMVEAALFGQPGGGARGAKGGAIAAARGGTLILASVEALPLAMQARLVPALGLRDLDGIGAEPAPLRVLTTTAADLAERVAAGQFRADLFYRLAPVRLAVPPLRDRRADIAPMFQQLLVAAARHYQRAVPDISDAMLAQLTDHDWPGNLRELQNFAEQAILNLNRAEAVLADRDEGRLPDRVARFEAEAIRTALRREGGRITATCTRLGIPRKTLYDKLAKYGINPAEFRS
jgi:two-component system C4-dicarboxylate transport response regulator DctD